MADREKVFEVLDFILNRASSGELAVIQEALKRRRGGSALGGLNPVGLAQNLAREIQGQLDASFDIQQVSRKIVADLIRRQEPNIKEKELEVLLDTWLPSGARERQEAPPPDVLLTMISQYVSFRQGRLPDAEQRELPEDWTEKYWHSFPEAVRLLITRLRNGQCDEVTFWRDIIASLGK
jgi:hypothetical protein